tara:strand:- start:581 stop:1213 length:633 start_codon:yes stop_codon:yes gene_type:complete
VRLHLSVDVTEYPYFDIQLIEFEAILIMEIHAPVLTIGHHPIICNLKGSRGENTLSMGAEIIGETEMPVRKNFGITNNNAVDNYVGQRLRICRKRRGLTLEQLGRGLGITSQQVQRYEQGGNRISASRLWDMAQILGVPIGYFFDEMDTETAGASPANAANVVTAPGPRDLIALEAQEALQLTKAYFQISDPKVRKSFIKTLQAVGGMAE